MVKKSAANRQKSIEDQPYIIQTQMFTPVKRFIFVILTVNFEVALSGHNADVNQYKNNLSQSFQAVFWGEGGAGGGMGGQNEFNKEFGCNAC